MGTDQNLCIFVLGMHRSGTSAMTRVLNLIGAALPAHLMDAAEHNQSGHWEPERIVEANDRLLTDNGSHWCDWRPPSLANGTQRAFQAEVASIVRDEFGNAPSIVIKDPRISRLVNLYVPVVNELGYDDRHVIVVRNPSEVAASLNARDGAMGPYAGLLWLRYQLDAERDTRGRPRAFVSFENLMADWRPELERILATLDLTFALSPTIAESIDAFLDPGEVHQREQPIESTDQVSDWAARTHAAFLRLAADPDDADSIATLDQVQAELDAVPAWAGDVLAEHAIEHLHEHFTLSEQLKDHRKHLDLTAADAVRLNGIAVELHGRNDELTATNKELKEQLKASRASAKKLREKVQAMEASTSWRLTKPLRRKGPKKKS